MAVALSGQPPFLCRMSYDQKRLIIKGSRLFAAGPYNMLYDMTDDSTGRGSRAWADRHADLQVMDRATRTDSLHVLVRKFVDTAMRESGWNRKRIIAEAAKHYRVDRSSIERALKITRGGIS
jgi:hypothetical protein